MVRCCSGTRQASETSTSFFADPSIAMAQFLSGPPGGRTLPLTPTRLSDLAGGVYGPGASVASTGLNGQRPAIKAARARAAGETWEDILEYYIVCIRVFSFTTSNAYLDLVQCRPWRNRLCLPSRKDLLSWKHIQCPRRYRIWWRRSWSCAAGLRARTILL